MLSFGEEVEEDEMEAANIKEKIKSIHDVLDDPRFLKEAKPEPLVSTHQLKCISFLWSRAKFQSDVVNYLIMLS